MSEVEVCVFCGKSVLECDGFCAKSGREVNANAHMIGRVIPPDMKHEIASCTDLGGRDISVTCTCGLVLAFNSDRDMNIMNVEIEVSRPVRMEGGGYFIDHGIAIYGLVKRLYSGARS